MMTAKATMMMVTIRIIKYKIFLICVPT